MYARFYRWATDRLEHDGVIAFISNRSFIDSRTFDGFRRDVERTFDKIYIVDLGGDVRANPSLSGTKHNVFGIQTGVSISFVVKSASRAKKKSPAEICYARRPEMETADDKLIFLANNALSELKMEKITPSKRGNWINQIENEWDDLLAVAGVSTKKSKSTIHHRSIFTLTSLGVSTNRDDWVIDVQADQLLEKTSYFEQKYNEGVAAGTVPIEIKTSATLLRRLKSEQKLICKKDLIEPILYRPYCRRFIMNAPVALDRPGSWARLFPKGAQNRALCVLKGQRQPFAVLATSIVPNLNLYSADPTEYLCRYQYTSDGQRIDNITDWALKKFKKQYGKIVTKDKIFHYCYAVLHDPIYAETYAINLKREFPHIPFYPDFERWTRWGERLMALHIGYEDVNPWALERVDEPKKHPETVPPKAVLKSDPVTGVIRLDADTCLTGVPLEAWDYKLGNRAAVDWVLAQYKEKKPRYPIIREKFNTYRFSDYKEHVIDLLKRVTTVSMETVQITNLMASLDRSDWGD